DGSRVRPCNYLLRSRNSLDCHLRDGWIQAYRRPLKRVITEVLHPGLVFVSVPSIWHCVDLRSNINGWGRRLDEYRSHRVAIERGQVSRTFIRRSCDDAGWFWIQDRYRTISRLDAR